MGHMRPETAKVYNRAYFLAHREKIRAYRLAHQEQIKAYNRAYRLAHYEKAQARDRLYHATHQEERNAKSRAYHLMHREERKAYSRAYLTTHKEERKVYNYIWANTHREMRRLQEHRRRARKMSSPCTATAEHEQAIKAAYKYKCAYCGKRSTKLTIDHVIPLAKNGGHTPENLVPACKSCNSAKKDRLVASVPPMRLFF